MREELLIALQILGFGVILFSLILAVQIWL